METPNEDFVDENGVKRPYTKGKGWLPWMFSMEKHIIAITIQMLFVIIFTMAVISTKYEFDSPFWFWVTISFICVFGILSWLRIYLIWRKCWNLEEKNHKSYNPSSN